MSYDNEQFLPDRDPAPESLRLAVVQMDEEWSEGRAMGQDRTEWATWRALIGWLTNVADRWPHVEHKQEQSHALHIAETYLGRRDPRDESFRPDAGGSS